MKKLFKKKKEKVGTIDFNMFTLSFSNSKIQIFIKKHKKDNIEIIETWRETYFIGSIFYSKLSNIILEFINNEDKKNDCYIELENFIYLRFMTLNFMLTDNEFLKIICDYSNSKVEESSKVLKDDISKEDFDKMKEYYKNKEIINE